MKVRKSSGCVVYRHKDGKLQFLIVSSSSGRDWVFPKGGVEAGMSKRDSAAKEVYEEAGVLGTVGPRLGEYRMLKGTTVNEVKVYAMKYEGKAEDWPERGLRKRVWLSASKACEAVGPYLAPFILDVVFNPKLNK